MIAILAAILEAGLPPLVALRQLVPLDRVERRLERRAVQRLAVLAVLGLGVLGALGRAEPPRAVAAAVATPPAARDALVERRRAEGALERRQRRQRGVLVLVNHHWHEGQRGGRARKLGQRRRRGWLRLHERARRRHRLLARVEALEALQRRRRPLLLVRVLVVGNLVHLREPMELVGRHAEARVDHLERLKQLARQQLVERHAGEHLKQPAEHVGRVGVPPREARLERKGQRREPLHKLLERHLVGHVPAAAGLLVHLVNPVVRVAVRQPRRVREQVAEGDLAVGRLGRAVVEHHHRPREAAQVLRDGLVELEEAALVQDHRRHRHDRLRHRVHAHQRALGQRLLGRHVGVAGRVHVAHLSHAQSHTRSPFGAWRWRAALQRAAAWKARTGGEDGGDGRSLVSWRPLARAHATSGGRACPCRAII
eukprot:4370137-Pleurochrysis_carterae.AAC.1